MISRSHIQCRLGHTRSMRPAQTCSTDPSDFLADKPPVRGRTEAPQAWGSVIRQVAVSVVAYRARRRLHRRIVGRPSVVHDWPPGTGSGLREPISSTACRAFAAVGWTPSLHVMRASELSAGTTSPG